MPAQNGTANIEGNSVFVAVSIPVASLQGIDDDGDGRLDAPELKRHQEALRTAIDRRLIITDGQKTAQTVLIDVMINPLDTVSQSSVATDIQSDQVLVLKHARFDGATTVTSLTVDMDFFGREPNQQQLTIKATRGLRPTLATEVKVLTPLHPRQTFFRSGIETFVDYLRLGVEHVLTGADHLVFLLTVIVAGVGLRYWLSVITAFTVAHSVSLGFALLGYLTIPPYWVEVMIALSIVMMAVGNLIRQIRRPAAERTSLIKLTGIVGVFGLIHGLGFASAIREIGIDRSQEVLSLLGFNLGIEIGQLVFLAGVLGVFWALQRMLPKLTEGELAQGISGLALLSGGYWLIERLL
jgi:hydrogenase/urease accessory protein HupE